MAISPGREFTRLFIDSSVIIAAAISSTGSARDLLAAAFGGEYHLASSALVLDECERNLTRKAPRALPLFHLVRAVLDQHLTEPPDELVREVARFIEDKDAPIVAAAIDAGARYLATYDRRHLLRQAAIIQARYSLIVATPDDILSGRAGVVES